LQSSNGGSGELFDATEWHFCGMNPEKSSSSEMDAVGGAFGFLGVLSLLLKYLSG
jgi:hypothetical protein